MNISRYSVFLSLVTIISYSSLSGQQSIPVDKILETAVQYNQIKDETNYGRVSNLGQIQATYRLERVTVKNQWSVSASAGFGFGQGIEYSFRPIDIYYGTGMSLNNRKLHLGPYIQSNLDLQFYIPFQSAEMRWLSIYEIGLRSIFVLNLKSRKLFCQLSNSILGFVSRPEVSRETHYYSMKFSDFLVNAHSELQFGSFDLFNHTEIKISIIRKGSGKYRMPYYKIEFTNTRHNATFKSIEHTVGMSWILSKN